MKEQKKKKTKKVKKVKTNQSTPARIIQFVVLALCQCVMTVATIILNKMVMSQLKSVFLILTAQSLVPSFFMLLLNRTEIFRISSFRPEDSFRWAVLVFLWSVCVITNAVALYLLPIPIFLAFSNAKYLANWIGRSIYLSRWHSVCLLNSKKRNITLISSKNMKRCQTVQERKR